MTPEEARAAVEWMVDRAIEEAHMSHGWVNPAPAMARCGGPAICKDCAMEECRKCGRMGLAATAYHAEMERTGGERCR